MLINIIIYVCCPPVCDYTLSFFYFFIFLFSGDIQLLFSALFFIYSFLHVFVLEALIRSHIYLVSPIWFAVLTFWVCHFCVSALSLYGCELVQFEYPVYDLYWFAQTCLHESLILPLLFIHFCLLWWVVSIRYYSTVFGGLFYMDASMECIVGGGGGGGGIMGVLQFS